MVDDCYKTPYAVNGPYWIGYDDVNSIALKAQFVNFQGVAGAMIWSMDTDDFLVQNFCINPHRLFLKRPLALQGLYSSVKYPLVRVRDAKIPQ